MRHRSFDPKTFAAEVHVSVALQQQVTLSQKVQETIETPQLQVIDEVVDVPAATQKQVDPQDLDPLPRTLESAFLIFTRTQTSLW